MKIQKRFKTTDDLWAEDQLKNVIAGCILNIKLTQDGICEKYLCEMNNEDVKRYLMLIEEIREVMIQRLNQ